MLWDPVQGMTQEESLRPRLVLPVHLWEAGSTPSQGHVPGLSVRSMCRRQPIVSLPPFLSLSSFDSL